MFPKKGFYKKAVHKKVIIILFSVMRLKLAKKQKTKKKKKPLQTYHGMKVNILTVTEI
jgi:hypothetical protein